MENKEILIENKEILIPEGCFNGNCKDCIYADWDDTDSYGRVYCYGGYRGYNDPLDRSRCFYYELDFHKDFFNP